MLYEVFDLQYASPATISRCGMVYVDDRNLGPGPYYDRWVRLKCGNHLAFKELLTNVSDEDVKKLSSYEKHGIELHRASRKRLYEEIEAEEDAKDEDEVQDVP